MPHQISVLSLLFPMLSLVDFLQLLEQYSGSQAAFGTTFRVTVRTSTMKRRVSQYVSDLLIWKLYFGCSSQKDSQKKFKPSALIQKVLY
jgi:hypothetical protein